jgi:hypothetical protein
MQAYMKSAMPYRGVNSPALVRIWKAAFASSAREFRDLEGHGADAMARREVP